jgi:type VI secretion system secreted protein Hcp
MAIDVYLQIDGIKGESQDSAHQGWIELSSAQWAWCDRVARPHQLAAATLPNGANTAP